MFGPCVASTGWFIAKKPLMGPARVLAYLGRYTHRVAIANSRIKALDDDHVAFTWKDYRQNGAEKIMRLKPDEFIRRFLLHTAVRRLSSGSVTLASWLLRVIALPRSHQSRALLLNEAIEAGKYPLSAGLF